MQCFVVASQTFKWETTQLKLQWHRKGDFKGHNCEHNHKFHEGHTKSKTNRKLIRGLWRNVLHTNLWRTMMNWSFQRRMEKGFAKLSAQGGKAFEGQWGTKVFEGGWRKGLPNWVCTGERIWFFNLSITQHRFSWKNRC